MKYRRDPSEQGSNLPVLVIASSIKQCWRGEKYIGSRFDWSTDSEHATDWRRISVPSCELEVTLLYADWWERPECDT